MPISGITLEEFEEGVQQAIAATQEALAKPGVPGGSDGNYMLAFVDGVTATLALTYPTAVTAWQVLDAAIRVTPDEWNAALLINVLERFPEFKPRKKHQREQMEKWGVMSAYDDYRKIFPLEKEGANV